MTEYMKNTLCKKSKHWSCYPFCMQHKKKFNSNTSRFAQKKKFTLLKIKKAIAPTLTHLSLSDKVHKVVPSLAKNATNVHKQ